MHYRSLVLSSILLPGSAISADIVFNVDNFDSREGQAVVIVFGSENEASFPVNFSEAVCRKSIDLNSKPVQLVCAGLPTGSYAAMVYHDTNANGKIDHSLFGTPQEQIGFSGNCKPGKKPPKFSDCAFDASNNPTLVNVKF